MTSTVILADSYSKYAVISDAYSELDNTGSLSRSTTQALLFAGFDLSAIEAANTASKETED